MKTTYIYPGRFSPPTKGHFEIVKRAAKTLSHLFVVCSTNPKKVDMFSTEESKELWKTYELPKNVTVLTYEEFSSKKNDLDSIVIVRGLRDFKDLADEQIVMKLNKDKFGIDKYLYFLSTCGFENISASKVREMAKNMELEKLSDYVSPLIVSALIEKTFELKNVFMVVGRPASGKSTFMNILSDIKKDVVHVDTDSFNKQLKSLLIEKFGEEDLVRVAVEREAELKEIIAEPWMRLLKNSILSAPKNSNLFIEIAYGLQDDKPMYKYVGGKILYVGCTQVETNVERLDKRLTSHMAPFVKRIPCLDESKAIAEKHGLQLTSINTDGYLQQLRNTAESFAKTF